MEDFQIIHLPDEVLLNLFSYMTVKELCLSAEVCTEWNKFVQDPALWKRHALKRFPYAFRQVLADLRRSQELADYHWKANFIRRLKIEKRYQTGIESSSYSYFLYGHRSTVFCVQPLGNEMLLSAGADSSIRLWDWKNKSCKHCLEAVHGAGILGLHYNPKSKRVISGSMIGELKIFDVNLDKAARVDRMTVREMKELMARNYVDYRGCLEKNEFKEKLLESSAIPILESRFTNTNAHIGSIVGIDAHNGLVATGARDPQIKLWNEDTGELKGSLQPGHTESTSAVRLYNDNNNLVSCGHDALIGLWNIETGKQERSLRGHMGWVWCLALEESSKLLVSGSVDRQIVCWDLATGTPIQAIRHHVGEVAGVWVDWDRRYIISAAFSSEVKIHDMRTFRCLHTLRNTSDRCTRVASSLGPNSSPPPNPPDPSPDGIFVGCFDGTVSVTDFSQGIL